MDIADEGLEANSNSNNNDIESFDDVKKSNNSNASGNEEKTGNQGASNNAGKTESQDTPTESKKGFLKTDLHSHLSGVLPPDVMIDKLIEFLDTDTKTFFEIFGCSINDFLPYFSDETKLEILTPDSLENFIYNACYNKNSPIPNKLSSNCKKFLDNLKNNVNGQYGIKVGKKKKQSKEKKEEEKSHIINCIKDYLKNNPNIYENLKTEILNEINTNETIIDYVYVHGNIDTEKLKNSILNNNDARKKLAMCPEDFIDVI